MHASRGMDFAAPTIHCCPIAKLLQACCTLQFT